MDFAADTTELVPVSADEDSFERGTALDDMYIRVQSREFRGGRVTAVASGVTVDLREAELGPEGATISVQSALSGICVLVPHDWEVVNDVDTVFAGVDSQRFPPRRRNRGPQLRLTGTVVAGGLCVR